MEEKEAEIQCLFREPEITRRALVETKKKHLESGQIEERIDQIKNVWPKLRNSLQNHLLPTTKLKYLLEAANAPIRAHQTGISEEHLKRTIRAARFITSRYTILDLLDQTGLLDKALSDAQLPL